MPRPVYIAGVGLTKVDLTGRVFGSVFDLFAEAYEKALADSSVRSFGAVQVGIMDSEEFENRANIAAKVADRLGLRGVPGIRTETASSTGAAAFHEAWAKVASEQCDSVLVLAGERMKNVTTQEATAIMSKTVDPVERRFGFTMPGLIALITQAWMRHRGIRAQQVPEILSRLMFRAHALGAENPLAAFHNMPLTLDAYFDEAQNLPVATPLMRKDCSPICDGAAAVILTSRPHAIRVAGLGSATESSSILDRASLSHLDATRAAARIAYWRAGVADPRGLEGLVVESHDAFNSLLPINLVDLGLIEPEEVVAALVGELGEPAPQPIAHPLTGVEGRLPVNLSGGLKARGHPVGGTGLFQIGECALQLTERFPSPRAQVAGAGFGIAHSVGGPGNNVYVTLLEKSDTRRRRDTVSAPRVAFQTPEALEDRREPPAPIDHARAVVEAATTIHVLGEDGDEPVHVAVLSLGGQRVFAKLDQPADEEAPPEELLAGRKVRLLVKDDGDQYFQVERGGAGLSGFLDRVRRRIGFSAAAPRRDEAAKEEAS
jgi:acetyl-CoA C-acetyltransferase